jgi:mitosis inhibitor protein kinase SWE1
MGYMHLDIKPGNIFIAFSGALKIGDFGMAMKCPPEPEYDIEMKEGDRAYIAQEVLDRRPGQPGDIFSLGVCMIEIAGNEALPPYGLEWESLRKGDISVAPTLSTSSSGEFVHRDEEGNPILTEVLEVSHRRDKFAERPNKQISASGSPTLTGTRPRRGSMLHKPKPGHLIEPPDFMENHGLEKIVKRMIAEDPASRPTASELLKTKELHWIDDRRRSTATIFEGLWGPSDYVVGLGADRQQAPRSQRLIEEDFAMDI